MFDVIIYIMIYAFLVFNYNCYSFVSIVQLKKLEIIIPHRWLSEIDDVLKDMQIGGMSATRIEGRGKVKPLPVAIQRGTSYVNAGIHTKNEGRSHCQGRYGGSAGTKDP